VLRALSSITVPLQELAGPLDKLQNTCYDVFMKLRNLKKPKIEKSQKPRNLKKSKIEKSQKTKKVKNLNFKVFEKSQNFKN